MRRIAGPMVFMVAVLAAGCGGADTADLEAGTDELEPRVSELEPQATSPPSTSGAIADARVAEALEEQTAAAEHFFVMCMESWGYEVTDVDIDYKQARFTPVGESTAVSDTQAKGCIEMAQGVLGPPDPPEYGDIPLTDEELMYAAMAYLHDEDGPWVLPMDVRSYARDIHCTALVQGHEPGTEAVQLAMATRINGLSDDADGRLTRGIMEAAYRHGCPEWLGDFEAATR